MATRARRLARAAAALAVAAVGCSDPDPIIAFDPDEPLPGLPSCTDPGASAVAAPDGLLAPPGAVLRSRTDADPLIQITGYAPMTPVQVRLHYETRDDVIVIHSEDEVIESELLVSDGTHRTYVKARAVCDAGSALDLVVAPEVEAEVLPEPTGAAG